MPHRKKIVAGNWKMNKTASEAKKLVKDIILEIGDFDDAEIVLCPPFTALATVGELLQDSNNIRLGAQNLHQEPDGAYTGEISAAMLRDLYCRYVIIGHSERRQYFHETNELIRKKIKAAIGAGLKPIVCIGETLAERETGKWKQILTTQLTEGLSGFEEKEITDLILAYEPVWAIGTGKTATPDQAQEAHDHVRGILGKVFSPAIAGKLRIQYGGSVKADNAADLFKQPDIDGALVGGASLDARAFAVIVKSSGSTR